tara:strand:+ start:554 stop:1459 length:906 start_codon:yes stop_codon:yes gene_type:complete
MSKTYLIQTLPSYSLKTNSFGNLKGGSMENSQLQDLLGTSGNDSKDFVTESSIPELSSNDDIDMEKSRSRNDTSTQDNPSEADDQQSEDNNEQEEEEDIEIVQNEDKMNADLVQALYYTICRAQSPFWITNPGVFIILLFYGLFYLVLINNEDMMLSSVWGIGLVMITLGKTFCGYLPRGYRLTKQGYQTTIEMTLRASFTMILAGYVASFFILYWSTVNITNRKSQCANGNLKMIRTGSIIMCLILVYIAGKIENHYNRHPSGEITKGLIIGVILGIIFFVGYSASLNPPFGNIRGRLNI